MDGKVRGGGGGGGVRAVSQPDAHVVGVAGLQLVAQALVEPDHLVTAVQGHLPKRSSKFN